MPPDNLDHNDVQEPVKVRCYCGNVGRMIEDKLICRQCIAKGRDGAPWPGDYYQKTGLFRDRGNEFNPSTRKLSGLTNRTSAVPPRTVTPQEVDSRTEMYGNLILKQRVDLAELCDLYNLRNMVIVGKDDSLYLNLMERSNKLKVCLVGEESLLSEEDKVEYPDRLSIVSLPSAMAANKIDLRVDAVFLLSGSDQDEQAVSLDINAWYSKIQKGGILSGSGYRTPQVKSAVQRFIRQQNSDIHLIYEKGEDGTQVNDICYYIWKRG